MMHIRRWWHERGTSGAQLPAATPGDVQVTPPGFRATLASPSSVGHLRPGGWGKAVAVAAFGAAAVYGAAAASAWMRYGRPAPASPDNTDALLDLFMPVYDVVDRHHIVVNASPEATFDALMAMNLEDSPVIRGIFRTRELVLGAGPRTRTLSGGVIEMTKALGWVELARVPGHEVVMGAVTRPWEADVVFRGVPAEDFAAFHEPGYVKIVWTLRADRTEEGHSIARTETRAVATDQEAWRRFRWYWARFSPGIILIRLLSLPGVRARAEALSATPATPP